MTRESNAPTVDHRHPDPAGIMQRIIAVAFAAGGGDLEGRERLLPVVSAALRRRETGEHREVAVATLAAASGKASEQLFQVYDSELPEDSPRTVKALLQSLGSSEVLEELANAVVRFEACHHVNLVKKFVSRYVSSQDAAVLNRSAEELFGYGCTGLLNALRGYDPSSNTLSTFANFRIIGAVRDGVRAESPVPKRLTTFVRKVESVEEKLTLALSRIPTAEEVRAELTAEEAKNYHLYPRAARQASLEELVGYNPAADIDVEHSVELGEIARDLHEELDSLPELERMSLQLLHVEGLSPLVAAKRAGVPKAELAAASERALQRLRQSHRLQQWAPSGIAA